ncbi:hypothetical protein LINPERPRIM_LOCUS9304 [Linum perenne]
MRQSGFAARPRQFHALVRSYINAGLPAYEIRGRMKADNIFPSEALINQIKKIDAFRRTALSSDEDDEPWCG